MSIRAYLEGQPDADAPTAYMLEGERLLILPTTAGPIRSAELLAGQQGAGAASRDARCRRQQSVHRRPAPVFANDDAIDRDGAPRRATSSLSKKGRTTQREVKDVIALLGTSRLAGVILNKYRGGLVSEGYGIDSYYAAGYGADKEAEE